MWCIHFKVFFSNKTGFAVSWIIKRIWQIITAYRICHREPQISEAWSVSVYYNSLSTKSHKKYQMAYLRCIKNDKTGLFACLFCGCLRCAAASRFQPGPRQRVHRPPKCSCSLTVPSLRWATEETLCGIIDVTVGLDLSCNDSILSLHTPSGMGDGGEQRIKTLYALRLQHHLI